MKTTKIAIPIEAPLFPQTLHTVRLRQERVLPHPPTKKQKQISRDLREDRGTREMKTENSKTFHAK